MPKFDYIIQNPPYKRGLHLDFFETSLQMLSLTGKMVIIEPATWLINLRTNGKVKRYNLLKTKIKSHVKSVKIENLNKDFHIDLYVPLSITTIDMSKTYNTIDFTCCGEHKTVHSIYDCNLIGDYNIVQSIINKCIAYGDMMNNHIYDDKKIIIDENIYFIKFLQIIGRSFCGDPRCIDTWFRKDLYCAPIFFAAVDDRVNISKTPHKALKSGYTYNNPVFANKLANNIYGTKNELENYKYNVYNSKLIPFINICMNIDQNNVTKLFIPWLVDKQYTDEEIYNLLDITKEERKLIDNTLIKFNRNSNWFKQYQEGPNWKQYCK